MDADECIGYNGYSMDRREYEEYYGEHVGTCKIHGTVLGSCSACEEAMEEVEMLDKYTLPKPISGRETLLNPFGERDYVAKQDYQTNWISECCGKEVATELDMSTIPFGGPTGFCGKCHDNIGFIDERKFYL